MGDHDYTDKIIEGIWARDEELRLWGMIEFAHLDVVAGIRATDLQKMVWQSITPESVATREAETGHEVGAFLAQFDLGLSRMAFDPQVEPGDEYQIPNADVVTARRFLHYGLTSSDLVESGRLISLWRSSVRLRQLAADLIDAVQGVRAIQLPGRTHGQIASPTSARARFKAALPDIGPLELTTRSVPIKLSGAVGQSRILKRQDQVRIASRINDWGFPVTLLAQATQVPPAWHYTRFLSAWLDWVIACEQIATDYRLMAAFGEVEPKVAAKVGSSAMPGKVNPFLAERVCGLAAAWKGMYTSVLATRALWLDRDLSHSSVDRQFLPALASSLGYMLLLVADLLRGADFVPVDMSQNEPAIDADVLLAFTCKHFQMMRTDAYSLVDKAVKTTGSTRAALAKIAAETDPLEHFGDVWAEFLKEYGYTYGSH